MISAYRAATACTTTTTTTTFSHNLTWPITWSIFFVFFLEFLLFVLTVRQVPSFVHHFSTEEPHIFNVIKQKLKRLQNQFFVLFIWFHGVKQLCFRLIRFIRSSFYDMYVIFLSSDIEKVRCFVTFPKKITYTMDIIYFDALMPVRYDILTGKLERGSHATGHRHVGTT